MHPPPLIWSFLEIAFVDFSMKNTNTWTCDSCGQPIQDIKHGWVEWLTRVEHNKHISRGLRLVHHCSAHVPINEKCQYNQRLEFQRDKSCVRDMGLETFVGANGLMELLMLIHEGDLPTHEVLEMIKRLHIPGYEHARHHFDRAIAQGVFEPNTPPGFYSVNQIQKVLDFVQNR